MEKRETKDKRVDHYFREFEDEGRKLLMHRDRGFKEIRLAKACAWRMARHYLQILRTGAPLLQSLVASAKKKNIDDWLDHWFEPVADFGDDHHELIQAVQDGMTLARHLSSTPAAFLHGKKRKEAEGKVKRSAPIPSDPAETLPPEERCKVLVTQVAALKDRNRLLEREVTSLRRQTAGVQKELRRMNRIMEIEATTV